MKHNHATYQPLWFLVVMMWSAVLWGGGKEWGPVWTMWWYCPLGSGHSSQRGNEFSRVTPMVGPQGLGLCGKVLHQKEWDDSGKMITLDWSSPQADPEVWGLNYWFIMWSQKTLIGASMVAQMVKNLPAMQEIQVWSLSWEDLPEKPRATHSSILAHGIPWTEEPGGLLLSMESQRIRHD